MSNPTESEKAFRSAYSVYIWLRDNPLIEESKTSKYLHKPDFDFLGQRFMKEVTELNGVRLGQHSHTDTVKDDIILEASEVWYWLAVADAAAGLGYDRISPHLHAAHGFQNSMDRDFRIDFSGTEELAGTTERCMEFLGGMCKKFGAEPEDIAIYDLEQMKQRAYLHNALRQVGYMK